MGIITFLQTCIIPSSKQFEEALDAWHRPKWRICVKEETFTESVNGETPKQVKRTIAIRCYEANCDKCSYTKSV